MELLEASQQIAQWGRCVQWQRGMQLLEAWIPLRFVGCFVGILESEHWCLEGGRSYALKIDIIELSE